MQALLSQYQYVRNPYQFFKHAENLTPAVNLRSSEESIPFSIAAEYQLDLTAPKKLYATCLPLLAFTVAEHLNTWCWDC
uniref:Type VI secretion protein VasK n=1 Tax=Ascaris lumbricoides TaxID=6252 RepID=A0A0M3HVL0_ASCLU